MVSEFDYDLFVIGAGSGGTRASRMASQYGAKVAVAEDTFMGGTCVNVGCVPKKLFVYGSHYKEDFAAAAGFGWSVPQPSFDWPTLRDNKTKEIQRLNGIYQSILDNAGVDVLHGHARILGPNEVQVGDRRVTAERILIAVGGQPSVPDIPGKELMITSNEAFYLETFPKSVLVLGGGYIAVEFAGIFNGLGASTELIYRGEQILRGFDREVRDFCAEQVAHAGVTISCELNIDRLETCGEQIKAILSDGTERIVDCVMAATGREPRLGELGLENTGVQLNSRGAVRVNDQFQTDEPSIYAIGDVIDRMQLTPVALAEAMVLTRNLYQAANDTMDYDLIATAVFCQPNIGTVGLSEEAAIDAGYSLRIYSSSFKPMKHTLSGLTERSLMKLVVDDATDKVLGCHMVGAEAGEIVQGIAIAMKMGATKADFDATVGIHPTSAEEFVTMRQVTRKVP